jgi:Predicted ATPases
MRIHNISVEHVLGVRRIQQELTTPVTLFAGGNRVGKSSLVEAIRMAFGEPPERVALKKEYSALVHEGRRAGKVVIDIGDGRCAGITLPDGKRSPEDWPAALPFVLEPGRFARADADARRTFLYDLTGCHVAGPAVRKLLAERGCDDSKVEQVMPMLRNGFPAAADFAKSQARDAKADWKAVTGDAYGTSKADTWKAEVPAVDTARLAAVGLEIDSLDGRIAEHAAAVGAMEARLQAYQRWEAGRSELAARAGRLSAAQAKLDVDLAELAAWDKRVEELQARAGAGPREGLVHDLANALGAFLRLTDDSQGVVGYHLNGDTASWDEFDELNAAAEALKAYEAQYGPLDATVGDPKAAAELPRAIQARDLMKRSVENDRRDVDAARAAAERLKEDQPEAVQTCDVDAARQELAELRALRKELEAERQRLDAQAAVARQAEQKTQRAAEHHAAVLAWLALADALSPDGIPGELLIQALDPINNRLRHSATMTGWMQVRISADMAITAAGRPYALLSESEKWRADAMLAEAIAHLSGLRLIVLDRMDVLEIRARGELLGWLDGLAARGEIESALVFATLKAAPSGLPDTIRAYWIAGGEIADSQPLAQAA